MTTSTPDPAVRLRFCPSPTGTPHVGMARTALFNWAFARHTGGTLVFRIEDTDAARDTDESMHAITESLEWLGIDYDEGPGVGGPYGPYRQSERHDLHREVAAKLLEAGYAYESFSSNEEVEARHRAAGRDPKLGYDNFDRDLTQDQKDAFRAEGREPVLRLRMPDEDITFDDMIRGEVTFKAGSVPDFVIVRGNGQPLYTLVNPVDDATMKITHIARGEDLLSSTPRQIALFRALKELGIAEVMPTYAHMPLVMGEGNRKLSKRDPQSNLFLHRDRGFTREGMINYLALLGWAIGPDRDVFSPQEFVEAFDLSAVNPNPARWDQKKAEAINADHIRMLDPADFTARLVPYLHEAGLVAQPPTPEQQRILDEAAPLIQTRIQVLGEAVDMVGFLFTADADLELADDATKTLREEAPAVLDAALAALEAQPEWKTAELEATLREAIVEGMGVKPKFAFGPLRVAVTGRRISPPLFESMEILGRESTLTRLRGLRARLDQQ